jgi:hypothetical protein
MYTCMVICVPMYDACVCVCFHVQKMKKNRPSYNIAEKLWRVLFIMSPLHSHPFVIHNACMGSDSADIYLVRDPIEIY